MKICPTCQASFPNGFQYCPNDTDALLTSEEYALRSQPVTPSPVPEATHLANQPQMPSPVAEPLSLAETPAPMPFRQPAEKAGDGRKAGQGPKPGTKTHVTPIEQPPALVAGNGAAAFSPSFSIPEPGSLISRLTAAVQQFVNEFGKKVPRLNPGDTGDFQFLLAEESLIERLKREGRLAVQDFRRDPRRFLIETFRGEGSTQRRRRLLQAGIAMAMIAYAFVFTSFLLAGLWRGAAPAAEKKEELVLLGPLIDTRTAEPPKEQMPKGKGDFVGGSKPRPERASGGGGGGRNQPTPPSKGNLPQASLTQQIVMPNPEPPKIQNPSLPVAMTVYADPKALPEFKGGPIGLPTGVPGPPSSGPGDGAGIGTGSGTGVGQGRGGGVGPGEGGNTGGGQFGLGGGGGVEEAGRNGAGKPTILYKEKAKYTEEARQNKVQGTVMLSAIFTADGRITGIRVIRGLPDGLTEKAIEAAQKIRFQPATKNGVAISVRANLEFNFALY
jgi:TonB family protein